MARGEARGRQRVIDLVDARPGMRVIDLACGPGNLTRRIAARVEPDGAVVGVDLAPGMIERPQAAGIANATFEVMDIEDLRLPAPTFNPAPSAPPLQSPPPLAPP